MGFPTDIAINNPYGPILFGRDKNYYQQITVSIVGNWNTNCDTVITFTTQGVQFLNMGSGIIEYSFNGNTVHGQLNSADASSGLTFDQRVVSKIWFRVKTGSTGPITVSVQAWSIQ